MSKNTIKIIGLLSLCFLGFELFFLEISIKEAVLNIVCLLVGVVIGFLLKKTMELSNSLEYKLLNKIRPEWYEICAAVLFILATAAAIISFINDGESGKALGVAIVALIILFPCPNVRLF